MDISWHSTDSGCGPADKEQRKDFQEALKKDKFSHISYAASRISHRKVVTLQPITGRAA